MRVQKCHYLLTQARVLFFIVIDIYSGSMYKIFHSEWLTVQLPLRIALCTKKINRLIRKTTNIINMWYNEITIRYANNGLATFK